MKHIIISVALLLLVCSQNINSAQKPDATSPAVAAANVSQKITVTQNIIGPYPKTGVTLMTFPLYNGCPDTRTVENAIDFQRCVDRWLEVTAQHLNDLAVDVFRIPFGAEAGNQIIGPKLLAPLETRPPFVGSHFFGDTMMIGWPEAEALAQATGADVMWVLNVRDICILIFCGTGTLERAQTVVRTLKGKVRYYELGSEDYRPSLLNEYIERINRFGGMIQTEDPQATYAAVLRDDFTWDATGAHLWKDAIVNTPGPHRLQRHLYFPADDNGITLHQREAEFVFSVPISQTGVYTLALNFTGAGFAPAADVTVSASGVPLLWNGVGFTGNLTPGDTEVTIVSQSDASFTLKYLFDLIGPQTTWPNLSVLEGKSGWELYMAGDDGVGPDFIPQNTGGRKVWVSEISDLGDSPAGPNDGQWGHRWLEAMAYASGFMRAVADPRVEIVLGHTLYEEPWFGMVSGVGRAGWQPFTPGPDGISMIAPKPRPKFWAHQQIALHLKNGQQLEVLMPQEYYQLDGSVQLGTSGRVAQQVPLLECWGSNLGGTLSLLCLNRAFDTAFAYPVEVEGSNAITAHMTLLSGNPGNHNEDSQPMIVPHSQTVQLSNVAFPARSLTRLEIAKTVPQNYLPVVVK